MESSAALYTVIVNYQHESKFTMHGFDTGGVRMGTMLKDHLLQVEQGFLVRGLQI